MGYAGGCGELRLGRICAVSVARYRCEMHAFQVLGNVEIGFISDKGSISGVYSAKIA